MMTPKEKLGIAIGALIVATWTSGFSAGAGLYLVVALGHIL
jgi:hypothetical protein